MMRFNRWKLCLYRGSCPFSIHLRKQFYCWDRREFHDRSSCYRASAHGICFRRCKRMYRGRFVYRFWFHRCTWCLMDRRCSRFCFTLGVVGDYFLMTCFIFRFIHSVNLLRWVFRFSFSHFRIRKIRSFRFSRWWCLSDGACHNLKGFVCVFLLREFMSLVLVQLFLRVV